MDPGAGSLGIFTIAFARLFQVRLSYLSVNDCPAGVELPAGLEIEEKIL